MRLLPMEIEIQFNSVTIQPVEVEENYPNLLSSLQSYLPIHKTKKRRRTRKKRTRVSSLIEPILEGLQE
jgi:hypothetical protein